MRIPPEFVIYMTMTEDAIILKEYREAFSKYAKDGVIDMDNRVKHKFNFQVHRLESLIEEVEGIIPLSRQSQYFVTLVKKGAGEKTIGHFTFPILKNTLFIIPKRVTNSSKYWSTDCSGYFLSFNTEFFLQSIFPKRLIINKKIFKTSVRPYLVLLENQVKSLEIIYKYILKEHKEQLKRKNEMIAIKVLELLVLCDRFFTDAETNNNENIYNEVVERFNELIEKNFTKERSVQFYANALHIHPNHLKFTGKKIHRAYSEANNN